MQHKTKINCCRNHTDDSKILLQAKNMIICDVKNKNCFVDEIDKKF